MGALLMERIDALRAKHSFIKEVRGKGLMIAIEFHEPTEFKLKMAWKLLHKVDKVLVRADGGDADAEQASHPDAGGGARHGCGEDSAAADHRRSARSIMFVSALDDVLTECRKFPGPMWEIGNNFVRARARLEAQTASAPAFGVIRQVVVRPARASRWIGLRATVINGGRRSVTRRGQPSL